MRYRFTLGEVLSWNIDIDVIVGNGWTRITLKEIPRFLVDAFDFIMSDGLQLDGIFRKEGNSARLNRPEVQEVYRGIRAIPADFTVLDVCTMVKRFLKDLKPTLLNSDDVRFKLIERAKKARLSGDFSVGNIEFSSKNSSFQRFPAKPSRHGHNVRNAHSTTLTGTSRHFGICYAASVQGFPPNLPVYQCNSHF